MAIIDDDITIIGVDVIIKGYDKRPRLVSINAGYNKLYKNDKTIRDLVAMCVQELGGLRLDDILDTAELDLNNMPVELDDKLKHYIDTAKKDYLGIPQIRLNIQNPLQTKSIL